MKVTLDKSICQMDKYKCVQVNLTNVQRSNWLKHLLNYLFILENWCIFLI